MPIIDTIIEKIKPEEYNQHYDNILDLLNNYKNKLYQYEGFRNKYNNFQDYFEMQTKKLIRNLSEKAKTNNNYYANLILAILFSNNENKTDLIFKLFPDFGNFFNFQNIEDYNLRLKLKNNFQNFFNIIIPTEKSNNYLEWTINCIIEQENLNEDNLNLLISILQLFSINNKDNNLNKLQNINLIINIEEKLQKKLGSKNALYQKFLDSMYEIILHHGKSYFEDIIKTFESNNKDNNSFISYIKERNQLNEKDKISKLKSIETIEAKYEIIKLALNMHKKDENQYNYELFSNIETTLNAINPDHENEEHKINIIGKIYFIYAQALINNEALANSLKNKITFLENRDFDQAIEQAKIYFQKLKEYNFKNANYRLAQIEVFNFEQNIFTNKENSNALWQNENVKIFSKEFNQSSSQFSNYWNKTFLKTKIDLLTQILQFKQSDNNSTYDIKQILEQFQESFKYFDLQKNKDLKPSDLYDLLKLYQHYINFLTYLYNKDIQYSDFDLIQEQLKIIKLQENLSQLNNYANLNIKDIWNKNRNDLITNIYNKIFKTSQTSSTTIQQRNIKQKINNNLDHYTEDFVKNLIDIKNNNTSFNNLLELNLSDIIKKINKNNPLSNKNLHGYNELEDFQNGTDREIIDRYFNSIIVYLRALKECGFDIKKIESEKATQLAHHAVRSNHNFGPLERIRDLPVPVNGDGLAINAPQYLATICTSLTIDIIIKIAKDLHEADISAIRSFLTNFNFNEVPKIARLIADYESHVLLKLNTDQRESFITERLVDIIRNAALIFHGNQDALTSRSSLFYGAKLKTNEFISTLFSNKTAAHTTYTPQESLFIAFAGSTFFSQGRGHGGKNIGTNSDTYKFFIEKRKEIISLCDTDDNYKQYKDILIKRLSFSSEKQNPVVVTHFAESRLLFDETEGKYYARQGFFDKASLVYPPVIITHKMKSDYGDYINTMKKFLCYEEDTELNDFINSLIFNEVFNSSKTTTIKSKANSTAEPDNFYNKTYFKQKKSSNIQDNLQNNPVNIDKINTKTDYLLEKLPSWKWLQKIIIFLFGKATQKPEIIARDAIYLDQAKLEALNPEKFISGRGQGSYPSAPPL